MKKREAIKILQQQIHNLKSGNVDRSNWSSQTKRYIIEIFGEESTEYDRFDDFSNWWIVYPNIGRTPPISLAEKDQKVASFLENCIEIIKDLGVTEKPKLNFLYTMKTEYVILLITGIAAVSFGLGTVTGILTEAKETNRLGAEITDLKSELKNCLATKKTR